MVTIKADIISGMLKGAFFMRSKAVSLPSSSIQNLPDFTLPSRPRRKKEVRDPYDGLRPWSAITHGIGAVLSAVGTVALLLRSAALGSALDFWVFLVYGLSMTGLYTASTLYHWVNTSVAGRIALRKYDHCSIYLLIAGSYTPVCLLGMILTIAKLSIPRWLTSAIYLFMGWLAIFAIVPLHRSLPAAGFAWLLAGGLLYTAGGVLYAAKWPGRNNPRFGCHEIFHLFILLGSIAHFVMMYTVIAFL